MSVSIVFNLYSFNSHLYLPAAWLTETDPDGRPSHLMQRATPDTLPFYKLELSPVLQSLFDLIHSLTPKAIEDKYKPPRAKSGATLAQLLQNPQAKVTVEQFIQRQLDLFISTVVKHKLLLALDLEKRSLAGDMLLEYDHKDTTPLLYFTKTPAGIEYRLRFGTEQQPWTVREREVFPLTNTEPAWLVAGHKLLRAPGINGNMVRPFMDKDVVHIPRDKEKVYFRQFIARNAGRARIIAEAFDVTDTSELRSTRLELMEHVLEKTWHIKPVFVYPGASFTAGERRQTTTAVDFVAEDDGASIAVRSVHRNPEAEAERLQVLLDLGLTAESNLYQPAESADQRGQSSLAVLVHWLARNRIALQQAGFEIPTPQYDGRPLEILIPELTISAAAEGDWFELQGQVRAGGYVVSFQAIVPYLRRGERLFSLPTGKTIVLPEEWFARYSDLAASIIQSDGETLRVPKALFPVLQAAGLKSDEAEWPSIDPDSIDFEPSEALRATLRPYQLRGVRWLVGHYRHGFGACLADDMGLGKTLQTIAALLHAKENRAAAESDQPPAAKRDLFSAYKDELKPLNALVVLPASLVFNWQRELSKFAPSLFVYVHTGPKRLKDIRILATHDVVLTTYHTARQDLELLEKLEWHYLVLDESQQIKNHRSDLSRVIRSLKSRNKISLSGTPIENSLSDVWAQMEFINPNALGSFTDFQKNYLIPIEKRGDEAARQRLFNRLRPFFLRRTKEEVAPDLPPLSAHLFYCEMTAAQRKQYEKVKSAVRNEILALYDDPKTRIQALQALTRLRQLACHPKLTGLEADSGKFDDVLAQWETIRLAGHKVLFFSSFEKHLQLFRAVFEEKKQPYAWLTGQTETADRAREVERFQNNKEVQAFFMTIKAGGVGLNLTAADYIFLLDPWWNPAVEEQAIARAHRIGQTRPVTAIRFLSRDTVEEKIIRLQERKRALGEGFFEENEGPRLSRNELEGLLI